MCKMFASVLIILWVQSSTSLSYFKKTKNIELTSMPNLMFPISSFINLKAQRLRLTQVLHEQPKPLEQITVPFRSDTPKSLVSDLSGKRKSLQLCTGLHCASGSGVRSDPRGLLFIVYSLQSQFQEDQEEWSPNGPENISVCKTGMCSGSLSLTFNLLT